MSKTPDINAILRADSRPCRYGAPMGDRNRCDPDPGDRLCLRPVRFVDYDYGADGTYWGGGRDTPGLWCAYTGDGAKRVRIYVRANSRRQAMAVVLEEYGDQLAAAEAVFAWGRTT